MLKTHRLGAAVQAAVVDVHCEATSEKMAMGHWCDGQASLVVGTHTHVPTADHMILPKGTAYLTDAGMCGDKGGNIRHWFRYSLFRLIWLNIPLRLRVGFGGVRGAHGVADDEGGKSAHAPSPTGWVRRWEGE